jgi:hypothetical protein
MEKGYYFIDFLQEEECQEDTLAQRFIVGALSALQEYVIFKQLSPGGLPEFA